MKIFSIVIFAVTLNISAAHARTLPVEIFFGQETQNKSAEVQAAVKQLAAPISKNLSKAFVAPNISDERYEITLKSSSENPYIPNSLFQILNETKGCDLNLSAGCVVLEKDSRSGKTIERAYFVGSAPRSLEKDLNGLERSYRVVRQEISGNQHVISNALTGFADGIYVFSEVSSKEEGLKAYNEALYPQEAQALLNKEQMDAVVEDTVPVATTELEKIDAMKAIEEIIQNSTNVDSNAIPQRKHCYVKAKMRLVKRVIIFHVIQTVKDQDGVHPLPTRISDPNLPGETPTSQLFCILGDGTIQKPKILLKDFQIITIGFALSKKPQTLYASGIGSAGGALDIFKIKEFGYGLPLGLQLQVPIKGFAIAPLLLSSSTTDKSVIAGNVSWAKSKPWWKSLLTPDLSLSIAGWYEIGIDPNDT